jgi:hypothetical protein
VRNVQPGAVIRINCNFTVPPKMKRLFVACVSPNPVLLIINTTPNAFVLKRLMHLQVLLAATENNFLNHDSFVDCSNPKRDFSQADLLTAVTKDVKSFLGRVSGRGIADIVKAVSHATTIEPGLKRLILETLQPKPLKPPPK